MGQVVFEFDALPSAPLMVDAIYKAGSQPNFGGEPLPRLMPRIGNQGGFRPANLDKSTLTCSFVVIFSSGRELEWPDFFDVETGIFRYYGDNRQPGSELHDTKRSGNALLRDVFGKLHTGRQSEIPPFFLFSRTGVGRDVRFLGLAAPGSQHISPDRDLVAFWRSMDGMRFQNYEAYFTVLNLGDEQVSREWIDALLRCDPDSLRFAPSCWRRFVEYGRDGILPLQAQAIRKIPRKSDQLPSDETGIQILRGVFGHYERNPYGFEACACEIVRLMDGNFEVFELTRPWRDGGRDAVGKYRIGPPNHALTVECALEAKCYGRNTGVGVKEMSRLISRIKYRQFGLMVTTSYVNSQAYKEVIKDGHPILIITGSDIARILIEGGVTPDKLDAWLEGVDSRDGR